MNRQFLFSIFMLPVAKALVITVLLGGGAVGTCALAGGFGPGGSSNGNAETTQTSTPEVTTPATNGQSQLRAEEAVPSTSDLPTASKEGNTVEGGAQNRGSSSALVSVDPGQVPGSTDSSDAPKAEPEVKVTGKEAISTEVQQRDSQEEATLSGNGQEPTRPETPGVSEDSAERAKINLGEGSNLPGTTGDAGSDSQTGKQNVKSSGGGDEQAAAAGSQDKGNAVGGNQADLTVTTDSNTNAGGSSPAGQVQA